MVDFVGPVSATPAGKETGTCPVSQRLDGNLDRMRVAIMAELGRRTGLPRDTDPARFHRLHIARNVAALTTGAHAV